MKMRILQLSMPKLPIRPNMKYGGVERVVRDLDAEYVRLGHESFVVAPGDSLIKGKLIAPRRESAWISENGSVYTKDRREEARDIHAKKAVEAIRELNPDAIHDNTQFIFSIAYQESGLTNPILTTLHWSIERMRQALSTSATNITRAHNHYNSVSKSQGAIFDGILPIEFNVYNAIKVIDYPFQKEKRNYLFSLGTMGENKGQDTAIKVAREIGRNLIIAGPVHAFVDRIKKYWEQQVKPHINEFHQDVPARKIDEFTRDLVRRGSRNGGLIVYVGEVDDTQKKEWFKYAKGFLMPIRWQEPFGLVMIEAMATGTPVVAYNRGAVPEIVVHNKTGYIAKPDDLERFIGYTSRLGEIDPAECRRHVESNFDVKLQAQRYLDVFEQIRQ